jgi:hypothetical protein
MAKAPDALTHPILGALAWEPAYGCWYGQHELPGGGVLFVQVDPGGDRCASLKRAADLFLWAMKNEPQVLRQAVEAMLELQGWRQGGAGPSAEELKRELEWQGLAIRDGGDVPVEFGYGAGRLFGGQAVVVELDAELRFLDVDLRE